MAWIESYQELREHPKTKRLARVLGISIPTAVGHLHCLWWWALDYAPDGDLSDYDPEDIADAAMWEGDAEAFLDALISCGPGDSWGFVERDEDGVRLHDWEDYGNQYRERQAAAERKRRSRARTRASQPVTVKSRDSHVTVTGRHGDVTPDRTDKTDRTGGGRARARVSRDVTVTCAPPQEEPAPAAAPAPGVVEGVDDPSVTPAAYYERLWGVYPPGVDAVVEHAVRGMQLDPSAVKWAMRESYLAGNRSAAYLRPILQRLDDQGLTTAAAAEEHERERRASGRGRARADPSSHEGAPNADAYRAVSAELVDRWRQLYPEECETG